MRLHPAGAVTGAELDTRASTEAIKTSPVATVAGRVTTRLEPNVVLVVTSPPDGSPPNAGLEPAVVAPRIRARASNDRPRTWAIRLAAAATRVHGSSLVMSPLS